MTETEISVKKTLALKVNFYNNHKAEGRAYQPTTLINLVISVTSFIKYAYVILEITWCCFKIEINSRIFIIYTQQHKGYIF